MSNLPISEPCLELLKRLRRSEEVLYLQRHAAEHMSSEASAQQELELIKRSTAFRLGKLIVTALRRPSSVVGWPSRVVGYVTQRRNYRRSLVQSVGERPERPVDLSGLAEDVGPSLPPAGLPPALLRELRVAGICDRFTADNLSAELEFLSVSRDRWYEQLAAFQPHLLFVESAWQGSDGEWVGDVAPPAKELVHLVKSCRSAGIPTVFWNKEDPLHYEAFISTASLFDEVFTTDADMIPRYRRDLGHARVHVLPFALQPKTHHPILGDSEERSASAFFAGAWYAHLPRRCAAFVRMADALRLVLPLSLYDRNYAVRDDGARFPGRYAELINGTADYGCLPSISRSHAIGLTVNTITQSSTMFARRALELIGCNTDVYSNYSRALHLLFGDLLLSTDDGDRILEAAWRRATSGDTLLDAYRRLLLLRKALTEHTWKERFSEIARVLWGHGFEDAGMRLIVVAHACTEEQGRRIAAMFSEQRGVDAELWLRLGAGVRLPAGANMLSQAELSTQPAALWPRAVIAPWSANDRYGPHYLSDMLLARQFSQGEVVGKSAYPVADGDAVRWVGVEREYRRTTSLALRRSTFPSVTWKGELKQLVDGIDYQRIEAEAVSIDRFSYMQGGAGRVLPEEVLPRYDEGAQMADVRRAVMHMPPLETITRGISGAEIAQWFPAASLPLGISVAAVNGRMQVVRQGGPPGVRLAASLSAPISALPDNGDVTLNLDMPAHTGLAIDVELLDGAGRVLTAHPLSPRKNTKISSVPAAVAWRLLLRLQNPLVCYLDGLHFHHVVEVPPILRGQSRLLLITNLYPSSERLYANAFVHRRVLAYRRRGVQIDVVRIAKAGEPSWSYEHEGVSVTVCSNEELKGSLRASSHSAVAVHFLDRGIWDALKTVVERKRVVVWVHGSDIQPWTRRPAQFATTSEIEAAKAASQDRLEFWRDILRCPPRDLHIVFVSRTFAEQCWEDLGIRLSEDRWSVIPNPIDTELFSFTEKPDHFRFRVLSVRPHHSRIYANDVVASVIHRLSQTAIFSELRFTLVGDGPLWEDNFRGLASYSNVRLVRQFLSQNEIAALHRTHGLFLVPTRGDTQGVSRDEAMASGLVPITFNAGAVGEFVGPESGVVAAEEDVDGLVYGMLDVLGDPFKFRRKSREARKRVLSRSSEVGIPREIALLGLSSDQGVK